MKAILSIIFSFILISCFAQQTRFLDLKSAFAQPENVKSLYINNYHEGKFNVNSLKVFIHLNNLELSNFSEKFDYANLFTILSEMDQIDTLNLSHCDFTIVPDQIGELQFLTCLKIIHCRKITVVSNELKQLKNLTYLDLSGNYVLTTIPDIFDSLENLKVLNLSNNKLNHLPPSICLLPKLEKLELHFNKLISLPEKIIELKQLKHLSLSGNPLTYLPADLKQLPLEEIYLGENQFNTFPYQVFDISTLRNFSIYSTDLDSLPQSVTKMTNLESVYLNLKHTFNWQDAFMKLDKNEKLTQLKIHGYQGEKLPKEISLLNNIRILRVQDFANTSAAIGYFSSMTDLTQLELPYYKEALLLSSIGALTNLKILKIEECSITTLSAGIGQLISLEELYISKRYDSNVLDLPEEIGNLVNLNILELSGCNLERVPRSIGNLINLKQLNLDRNKLVSIPNEIASLTLLESLSLYDNKIQKVSAKIWKLKSLVRVFLSRNNIVEFEIPDSVSISLTNVDLSENINLKIVPDFFGKLSNLKYLDLECTQVVQLPASLKQNSNLKAIYLSSNLIKSDIIFNAQYGGVIEFKEKCESLERLVINFHDRYGKITTDIKTNKDSITLYYHYSYNEPDVIDEEYDENVFFVLNKADVKEGSKFILPDSLVRISVLHLSIWDMLLPELKFKYENLQGEITFVSVEKNKITAYIYLFCDGYDDTDRILIGHKTIVFKKKK